MGWGIHTVYIPREELRFLEEWLAYHTMLGAEYFHLYDNTGSTTPHGGHSIEIDGKNRHGKPIDMRLSNADILEVEADIFKKYPVTKTIWQPMEDGRIVHGHVGAVDHFGARMKDGWCAFIDIDEFIYSPFPITDLLHNKVVVMDQKKFHSRFEYDTALEITKCFKFNTRAWAPKLIIDMEHYLPGGPNIHSLNAHLMGVDLTSNSERIRFNHYNHNQVGHDYLLQWLTHLDPSWVPVPYEDTFTERDDILRERAKALDYGSFILPPGWR
jgi:hypothetical protein